MLDYLSYRHNHSHNPNLQVSNPEAQCSDFLNSPLDEVVAAHLRCINEMKKKNYNSAYEHQTVLVQNLTKVFQGLRDENWLLPAVNGVCLELRMVATHLMKQPGTGTKPLEKAAECLMACFRICTADNVKETTFRTMSEEKKLAWRCMHKYKRSSTSVSSKSNIQTPVKIGLTSNCDNELKTMIASLTSKVEGFESILKEVKDSQNFISGMYDETLNEIKELKKQNQSFKHEVVGLKRKVEDRDGEIEELRMKVNDMDQYNRRFNPLRIMKTARARALEYELIRITTQHPQCLHAYLPA
ncbi:PCI domain-containing protein 2 [Homalodisca vitripennis]|nr:PCI domain-containing protein 2 [Homalodisca vitripennis]